MNWVFVSAALGWCLGLAFVLVGRYLVLSSLVSFEGWDEMGMGWVWFWCLGWMVGGFCIDRVFCLGCEVDVDRRLGGTGAMDREDRGWGWRCEETRGGDEEMEGW